MDYWCYIFSFIVVIVVFSTIGGLVLLVKEKHRDLGLFLSIGATPKQIQHLFEIQGICILVLGTVFGLIISIPFCLLADYYKLIKLPISVYDFISFVWFNLHYFDIVLVAVLPTIITWLASRYPAISAAKINTINILKSEL